MGTLPTTGAPDWTGAQGTPWVSVNQALRILDAFARYSAIEDRDLTAPPGSCDDGAAYLIDATATGDWLGHDGELAIAVGEDAANGWYFVVVEKEGTQLYIRDENLTIRWNGSAWADAASSGQAFEMIVAVSDETTPLSTGLAKITFPWPADVTLSEVVGFVADAADSSSSVGFDVRVNGSSIFSNTPSIDPGAFTSHGGGDPGVISTADVDRHDIVVIDILSAGDSAAGLKVLFIGTRR